MADADFPIWKTVTLGTFRSIGSLRRALLKGGYYRYIGDENEDREYRPARSADELDTDFEAMLARTPLAVRRTKVDLVRVTLPQLGFEGRTRHGLYLSGPMFHEITYRIWNRGWRLCPAEVALQLRLQYPRQPLGEVIEVAVEPIHIPGNGYPFTYVVFHDGCGRFVIEWEKKHGELSTESFWVFVKPRTP